MLRISFGKGGKQTRSEFRDAFARGATDKLHLILFGLQVLSQARKPLLAPLAAELVRLGEHHERGVSPGVEQVLHPPVFTRRSMPDVQEPDHAGDTGPVVEVMTDQLPVPGARRLAGLGESVPRKIDQIKRRQSEHVDEGRLPRGGAYSGQVGAPQQRVDEAGLPHIGTADEREFGEWWVEHDVGGGKAADELNCEVRER